MSGANYVPAASQVDTRARVAPVSETPDAQVEPVAVHPAAALFAFMGWVTCRAEPVTLGASHDAAIAAELVSAFCDSQGWGNPPENWTDTLKPYPVEALR